MTNENESIGRRKFLSLAGSGIATVSLAGCSGQQSDGGDGGGGGGTSTATSSPEPSPTEAGTPSTPSGGEGLPKNTMSAVTPSLGKTADPHKVQDFPTTILTLNFYDPFIFANSDTQLIPWIATEWESKEGGKVWRFTIEEGIPLHSGRELTAEDVAYNFNRALQVSVGYLDIIDGVVKKGSAKAIDDRTVEIELNFPYGPLLAVMTRFFILDSKVAKEQKTGGDKWAEEYFKENVAGSGAYTLVNMASGDEIVYEAFPDYWKGWKETQFKEVNVTITEEESTIRQLFSNGDIQYATNYLSIETLNYIDDLDNGVLKERQSPKLYHSPLNCQKPPTDDINVRKAIIHSFDYNTARDDVFKSGIVAHGPVPKTLPGHNNNVRRYKQDFDKAKAALDQAEYSVDEINNNLEITYIAGATEERKLALLLQSNLKKIGLDLSIRKMQWPTFTGKCSEAETTPVISSVYYTGVYPTPDSHTYLMYHPSKFGTWISASWYSTDELKNLLEEARQTTNREERYSKYKEAQKMIVDGYPSIFMVNIPRQKVMSTKIKGWTYRGLGALEDRWHDMFFPSVEG